MSPVKLLKPAIVFLNKRTFKAKIRFLISILMSLLILPSITYLVGYANKKTAYERQERALNYVMQIHHLITLVQIHRGLSNGYLYGNQAFEDKIRKIEPQISQKMNRFLEENKEHLAKLHELRRMREILHTLHRLELSHITSEHIYPSQVFNTHTQAIRNLIEILQKVADRYGLDNGENIVRKHLAQNLTDNLLLLQEDTGVLRGIATGILSEGNMTEDDRDKLFTLYAHISAVSQSPSYLKTESYLDTFPKILETYRLMHDRLEGLLYITRRHILQSTDPTFKAEKFFILATDTIETQYKLYHMLADQYIRLLHRDSRQHMYKTIALLLAFILIIAVVSYLAAAFYLSVTRSIRKLQTASKLISRGKTAFDLANDTEDEVNVALNAFQKVGNRLDENISFLNSYKKAIDEASIVSKTDKRGIITYANKKFCAISQYSQEELLGKPHNIVRHPDMPKSAFKEMWETIRAGNIWHGIVKNRKKDGSSYIVDTTIMPIFDAQGEIMEYIAIRHNVTELAESRKRIQEEMQKQKIDALTGLPNKIHLLEDIAKMQQPVLFYLNINEFANLNDFYGNKTGDKVLRYVGDLLQKHYASNTIGIYKLSGDAFVVLFEEESIQHTPEIFIDEIIDYIEYQTSVCSQEECISVTLTGGIATYHETQSDRLLSCAGIARKYARQEHKSYLRYTHELNKDADYEKNIAWINKIKEALQDNRIETFYQPIVDNRDGSIRKYETLVRLVEKNGKVISPFFFLEIAKQAKLYTQITKVVFDKAFDTFKAHPHFEFSINISIEDITDTHIRSYIFEKLAHFPRPQNVILEITEDQEITDYDLINDFIRQAKQYGTKIAIDDFGSGYANFDHIIKLNADFIKIDGSLIKNIDTDEESRIITEAIIAFSKKLGSKTVVEFVHNETILQIVTELGADFVQGYHLGAPSPCICVEEKAYEQYVS